MPTSSSAAARLDSRASCAGSSSATPLGLKCHHIGNTMLGQHIVHTPERSGPRPSAEAVGELDSCFCNASKSSLAHEFFQLTDARISPEVNVNCLREIARQRPTPTDHVFRIRNSADPSALSQHSIRLTQVLFSATYMVNDIHREYQVEQVRGEAQFLRSATLERYLGRAPTSAGKHLLGRVNPPAPTIDRCLQRNHVIARATSDLKHLGRRAKVADRKKILQNPGVNLAMLGVFRGHRVVVSQLGSPRTQ